MQPSDSLPIPVILAVQDSALLEPAMQFMRGFSGVEVDVQEVPYEQLTEIQDLAEESKASLIVLAIRADEAGYVDVRSEFGHVSLDSEIPVMVLRAGERSEPAFTMPNRIIVPLDGSATAAQALPLASRIAQLANLPVKFVMVIDPSRVIPAAYAYDPEAWGVISDLRQTAHWALRQAEEQFRNEGIEVEADLLFGPVNACLQEAVEERDVVVMTTHGSGRANYRKVGSVAVRVLSSVSRPIVLMRAATQADVIVEGYEACSWVEPLTHRSRV